MGLFDGFFNGNNNSNSQTINMNSHYREADDNVDGVVSDNASTMSVDESTVTKIAALYQGISIISDSIASLPVYLFKEEDGFQQVFYNDPRSRIMSGMANEVLTSFNLKKIMLKDLILHGNAYAKIVRDDKTGKISLYYIPVDKVIPKKDSNGYYFEVASYQTDVVGERIEKEVIDYYDMLVLIKNPQYNSIKGNGLLEYAKDIFEQSMQESNYMLNLFKNGLSAKAILSSKTPFKKEVKSVLKRDLQNLYSGSSNAGKMLVLEGDISVQSLALTPADIKLIDNCNFSINQISRFLNIPKHLLNMDKSQGTYSNITQERLNLLQTTLLPYVVAFEEALNQKLLTEEEIEQGYYYQFDTSEMLKLTPEENAKYALDLYREDVITLEETRLIMNLGGKAETIKELKEIANAKLQNAVYKLKSEETDTKEKDTKTSE